MTTQEQKTTQLIRLKHPPTGIHSETPWLISTIAAGQQVDYSELLSGACFFENLKEGDIITFPSYVTHRSPPTTTDRKTVIAGNFNFTIVKDSMIQ